jgi:protease I
MADELQGKKIAFLVAREGVEKVGLTESWEAVKSAGGTPELLSTASGKVQVFNHLGKEDRFDVGELVNEASHSEYAGLVIPGGVANCDILRMDQNAVDFVREIFESGRQIGVIGHAPWTLVQAKVLGWTEDLGRTWRLTSWPSLKADILNAGGEWIDEAVVEDYGGIVSSRNRWPNDLPAFCSKIVEEFASPVGPRRTRPVR